MNLRQWLCAEPQRSKILRQLAGGAQYFDHHVDDVVDFVRHNPKLRECSRDSLIAAIAKSGSWGVKVGRDSGVLLARKVEGQMTAVAMLHYRAEIQILKAKRLVRDIEANCVYANEHFIVHKGTQPKIEHHVITEIRKRGALVAGYCFAETSRRQIKIVTMDRNEIDRIRVDHSDEMADGELDDIAHFFVPKTCVHAMRREIGLPEDYLIKYDDDFERGRSLRPRGASGESLGSTQPVTLDAVDAPNGFPVDPRAPKAAA